MISGILIIIVLLIVGSVGSNILIHTLRPFWSRKKHILLSSMLPPFCLWLLVSLVILLSGGLADDWGLGLLVPVVTLAIILLFLGALIGIPVSWLILKQVKWEKSNSADDIFG